MSNNILQHKLENGLTVVGEPNKFAKSVSLGFFVKTGGRDEQGHESGLSHFLEHMMFKGTAKRSAEQVNFDLGNIGAQANAYTSEENTVYYASVLPENFPALHEILSDMLRPALDPKEFYTEQKVILEEIALYKDRPQFWFFQQAIQDFYRENTLGQPVLGTEESVAAFTPEVMQNYFDRRYSPHNIVCSCAGNFEWSDFVALCEKHCAHWLGEKVQRTYYPFPATAVDRTYHRSKLNQAQLLISAKGFGATDEQRFAVAVLANILGDHVGSRLYWSLIETGLAESVGASNDENDGSGLFSVHASATPEALNKVQEIILKHLKELDTITAAELARSKTKIATRIVASGELPIGRMMAVGNGYTYRGKADTLENILKAVEAVSLSDIKKVAQQLQSSEFSHFRMLPE